MWLVRLEEKKKKSFDENRFSQRDSSEYTRKNSKLPVDSMTLPSATCVLTEFNTSGIGAARASEYRMKHRRLQSTPSRHRTDEPSTPQLSLSRENSRFDIQTAAAAKARCVIIKSLRNLKSTCAHYKRHIVVGVLCRSRAEMANS